MPNTSEISVPAIDTRPPLPSKALVDSFQNRGAEMPFPLNPMLRELADLSNFRANAVIDFIRLEFETVEPTQFRWIQALLEKDGLLPRTPWVDRQDALPGGSTCKFVLHIHDPSSHRHLLDIVAAVAKQKSLRQAPRVVKIEVAVDFYSKTHDRHQLDALALRLKHGLISDVHSTESSAVGSVHVPYARELRADTTFRASDGKNCEFRIYVKTTDNNKEPIPDHLQHRTRIEQTLSDVDIPLSYSVLDGEASYRFQEMNKRFVFRPVVDFSSVPDAGSEPARRASELLLERAVRLGSNNLGAPKRLRRKHHPRTVADPDLKSRMYDALRDLTRRHFAKNK